MDYLFFPMRVTRKMIRPITATTINIPTPTPALNIPPITSQDDSDIRKENKRAKMAVYFFIALRFKLCPENKSVSYFQ